MFKHYPLCFIALLLLLFSCKEEDKRLHALYEGLPFDMPKVEMPSIPAHKVVLTDYGAAGDGITLCTEAFARAIEALEAQGGGCLEVPDGIWLTGPVGLKSHIRLHLADNAVIVFSADQDLYPIIDTNFEGLDVRRCLSPLYADGATDIAITGKGTIDGSGYLWRELKKRKVGDDLWKETLKRGGVLADDGSVWYPDEGYKKARLTAGSLNKPSDDLDENEIKTFLRPVMVSLKNCERVLLEDVTFQDSPAWNIHPLWCKDVIIKDINVRNPHYSTNGDGIDLTQYIQSVTVQKRNANSQYGDPTTEFTDGDYVKTTIKYQLPGGGQTQRGQPHGYLPGSKWPEAHKGAERTDYPGGKGARHLQDLH